MLQVGRLTSVKLLLTHKTQLLMLNKSHVLCPLLCELGQTFTANTPRQAKSLRIIDFLFSFFFFASATTSVLGVERSVKGALNEGPLVMLFVHFDDFTTGSIRCCLAVESIVLLALVGQVGGQQAGIKAGYRLACHSVGQVVNLGVG